MHGDHAHHESEVPAGMMRSSKSEMNNPAMGEMPTGEMNSNLTNMPEGSRESAIGEMPTGEMSGMPPGMEGDRHKTSGDMPVGLMNDRSSDVSPSIGAAQGEMPKGEMTSSQLEQPIAAKTGRVSLSGEWQINLSIRDVKMDPAG
jgi:hypothetical protein